VLLLPGHITYCHAVLLLSSGDVLAPNLKHLELDYDRRDLQGLLVGPLAAPTVTPLLSLTQLQVCIVLVRERLLGSF
jgi:hypothetical protein